MDTLLLGITVISLIVAFVMSMTAWRVMRDDKRREAARVAALATAASNDAQVPPTAGDARRIEAARAPWAPAFTAGPRGEPKTPLAREVTPHAAGFLGAVAETRDSGDRQRALAAAAFVLFAVLSGGLVWMMSGPEGTSAVAVGPNSPLELVSLSHSRQNARLSVSGLIRNPANGKPVERVSAVVFLFDRAGTFVTSSRAHLDFLKLAAGDESPFVVSLDAPPTVARYRVSFRTDEGVVPHIDRRGDTQTPTAGEMPVSVNLK